MITPNDIMNANFNKSFRGFDATEVKDFLEDISEEVYKILKENSDLKHEIDNLNDEINLLKQPTESISDTDCCEESEEIDNTELFANELQEKNERLAKQNSELESLINEKQARLEEIRVEGARMVVELKNMLNKHLEIFNQYE